MMGRRGAFLGMAAAMAGGSLITALAMSAGPTPVDVRQVQASQVAPSKLSATYTTTVLVVASPEPSADRNPPPHPPPPPPPRAADPPPHPPGKPPPPPPPPNGNKHPPWLPPFLQGPECEPDGDCEDWLFPPDAEEQCAWLRDHGWLRLGIGLPGQRDVEIELGIVCTDGEGR